MSKLSPKDIEALARDVTAETASYAQPFELERDMAHQDFEHHPSPGMAAGLGLFEPVCAAIWLGKSSWAFGFLGISLGLVAFAASPMIETKGSWLVSVGLLCGFRIASAIWAWKTAYTVPATSEGQKWGRGWATVAAVWIALMGITVYSEATAGKVAPMPIPASLDLAGETGPGVARLYPRGTVGHVSPGTIVLWVDSLNLTHMSRVVNTRPKDVEVQLATGGTTYVDLDQLYGRIMFRLQ
ncbi:MAG: hypothetical protein Alpg2KO_08480 [Alphaproteobacteria bacterium]